MTQPPKSPTAFKTSLRDRLKTRAKSTGRPFNELEREYLLQRFLARVFADPDSPWILKGGTGLLARLPGARHSQDIDLLHRTQTLEAAADDLRRLATADGGDPFRFVLTDPVAMTGTVNGAQIRVTAYLGATVFGRFPIDLSTELAFVAEVERHRPTPVIEVPDVAPLPEFTLYPLVDQVADKVCAMYERHGPQQIPSTRFRDLVDLVLITREFPLDGDQLSAALAQEAQRRGLTLPATLVLPDSTWTAGYPKVARPTMVPKELQTVPAALEAVARCIDPVLVGQVAEQQWEPGRQQWVSAAGGDSSSDRATAAGPPVPGV
ncbi:nucleotidyl transferase AbiEii/AbiGii toxin family protein [Blastococcus sp. KM273129]|uniref:nucleotidyl transferase AbiEii/AbiGii toxin family protein n=1 Tax=Blastococcus sp. KM273129 TaxID=2570315 RepID=UPI001F3A9C2B|nr:nucleotidyl transferase AbiEii/AbiGii toxin family protein [Blastococcus sp. KM273129]MCF6733699.1 nucleotidyl transferase AbiEii/AbiGii toxin family protein [Blastococcus sp. KM273129]